MSKQTELDAAPLGEAKEQGTKRERAALKHVQDGRALFAALDKIEDAALRESMRQMADTHLGDAVRLLARLD